MKNLYCLIVLILFTITCSLLLYGCADSTLHVETGLDITVENNFKEFAGKRVGLLTNHSGLTKDGQHVADVFHNAENVNLTALFGPEHGIRGNAAGGVVVKSQVDSLTVVPIFSLYTKNKRPTQKMLNDIDILVFDIQDVGARFYTYIYTMAFAMEAAAIYNKKFIVLDRPNPINGTKVEGPLLKEGFESFVGLFKLPIRHGMTAGELALMFKEEKWLIGADSLDLKIIKMSGWKRGSWIDQTDVPWTAPSPNMKSLATATVYPGVCLIEGTIASEGRGTNMPFEQVGAPWVDALEFAAEMNKHDLAGVTFEPVNFTPIPNLSPALWLKFKAKSCGGVFIKVIDRQVYHSVRTGIALIWTLKKLYPQKFAWTKTVDRLYGSDLLRKGIDTGQPLEYFFMDTEQALQEFLGTRQKYLLYPQ